MFHVGKGAQVVKSFSPVSLPGRLAVQQIFLTCDVTIQNPNMRIQRKFGGIVFGGKRRRPKE
jgi:hypothetical protein